MLDVLIVPAAGKSTRFPGTRPKWLLTHPDGRIMGAAALDHLPRAKDVIVVTSKAIANEYGEEAIRRAFLDGMENTPVRKLRIMAIKQTPHQPATVAIAAATLSPKRSIMVKDTDNTFSVEGLEGGSNGIACVRTTDQPLLNARNKCYVEASSDSDVLRCAERQPISDTFACGLYSFARAGEFLAALKGLWSTPALYPSSVVNALLSAKKPFQAWKATGYEDWGTLPDWLRFKSTWRTLFVDVDGVILKNGGQYFAPLWGDCVPILENVAALRRLHATGRVQIVLTTARPLAEGPKLRTLLEAHGVPFQGIITGMHHAQRVLVNDFAATNPYPTAAAINLVRNANDLDHQLRGLFKDF